MATNGIMQDIRTLLTQGQTSSQVIALGNKPSTVYKVQRQLRQQQRNTTAPTGATEQDQPISGQEVPEGSTNEGFSYFFSRFRQVPEPTEADILRAELGQARSRIEELEQEAGDVQTLQNQVQALEAEVEAIGPLLGQVRQLEGELEQANRTQESLLQSIAQWQIKVHDDQSGRQADRQEAERQSGEYRSQINQWQQAYQTSKSQLDAASQVVANLRAELQQLEPLKAWVGHPCSVCHIPMTGSVDRALAAQLNKDLAHKACLEQQSSGLGKMLLAGGAILGLSQLGKK